MGVLAVLPQGRWGLRIAAAAAATTSAAVIVDVALEWARLVLMPGVPLLVGLTKPAVLLGWVLRGLARRGPVFLARANDVYLSSIAVAAASFRSLQEQDLIAQRLRTTPLPQGKTAQRSR